ncbi:MAG: hypothetical protein DMG32_24635 [Acidobacteria bacterium]|nr:MAG: hypothetical protein DMG32_24635 [Acidobacteriota bacterium]
MAYTAAGSWSQWYLCCPQRTKRQKSNLKIAFGGGRLYLLGRLDHPTAAMTTFTFAQVVLSLVGIGSGFVVVFGLLTAKRLDRWTALFLASTRCV